MLCEETVCTLLPSALRLTLIDRNMGASLYNGGPQALVWGCMLVVVSSLSQALSMAELGSILPIAGAQYHWTDMLAPESSRRVITWFQGWVTWFAWVSALGGSSSSLAFSLQGVIAENLPGYAEAQKSWHLAPIMIAIFVTNGLINSYAFSIFPWLELASGVAHCLLFIVFVGVFAGLGTGNSAEFVFTNSTSYSGWGKFVAFDIGMLVPAWGFIGFDGVNHMFEEVRRARHAVPRAMVYTILINGALALIMALVIMFQMGDVAPYLESGHPITPIFMAIAGTKAANNALVSGLLIITYCVVAASLASFGRITWAWARDGALTKVLRTSGSQVQSARSSFMASDLDCITTVIAERRLYRCNSIFGLHFPLVTGSLHFLYHRHRMPAQCSPHRNFRRDVRITSSVRRMASSQTPSSSDQCIRSDLDDLHHHLLALSHDVRGRRLKYELRASNLCFRASLRDDRLVRLGT